MRGIFAFVGGVLMIGALALFYAEHKNRRTYASAAEDLVRQILLAQNEAASSRVEAQVQRSIREVAGILSRTKKRTKGRGYVQEVALNEPDAPKWIWSYGKRIKAAGLADFSDLEREFDDFIDDHRSRFEARSFNNKTYLFLKGNVANEGVAAVFEPEALFRGFGSDNGMRVWIVARNGNVAFHTRARFLGSNAANLRPVASGLRAVSEGRRASVAEKYLGLDGKAALGAWSSVPELGILVGSEWGRPVAAAEILSASAVAGLIAAVLGAFFMGCAFQRSGTEPRPSERIFEIESRLDQDALDYLAQVKGSAEQAIEYAKDQEKIAHEAARQRAVVAGQFRFLEWKLLVLEEFQSRVLAQTTGKQVWPALARLIAARTPGLIVTNYRYSPSSFSLVPESLSTALDLDANAEAYLSDARIFIGKPQLARALVQTEAFQRWNKTREKHMPLHTTEFRAVSFEYGGATKGVILIAHDARMNRDGELSEAFALYEDLIRRASSFCDSLSRLVQSSNGKGTSGQALAGASDDVRGEPRPS